MKPSEQELTQETIEALKDLLLNESVWALRVLRELATCSPSEEENLWSSRIQSASPERLSALHQHSMELLHIDDFRTKLIGDVSPPDALVRWTGQLEKYAAEIDPYVAHRPELMSSLNLFRTRFSQILTEEYAVTELQALIEDIRAAETEFVNEDIRKELSLLRASTIYHLGLAYYNGGKAAQAITVFMDGLAFCEENRIDAETNSFRLRLAYLYQKGASKIDDSLRQILPLYEAMKGQPVNLDRIDLQLLLADTYLKAEDFFESRDYLNRAVEELDQLNLSYMPMETANQFLNRWQSLFTVGSQLDIYRHFKIGMSLQMRVQRIRSGLSKGEEERNKWEECFYVISRGDFLYNQLEAEVDHQGDLLLFEMGIIDWVRPNKAIDADLKAAAMELSKRVEECQQRLAAGDFSEETLALINSISQLEVGRHKEIAMLIHQQRGDLFSGRNEFALADEEYTRAFDLATEIDNLGSVLYAVSSRLSLRSNNDREEILALALQAISCIESARSEVSTPYQRGSFLKGKTIYYDIAMLDAHRSGRLSLMIRTGELLKGQITRIDWMSEENRREITLQLAALYERIGVAEESTIKAHKKQRQHLYDSIMLARPNRGEKEDLFAGFSIHLGQGEACISYYQLENGIFLIYAINGAGDHVIVEDQPDPKELDSQLELYASQDLPSQYRARQAGNWYTVEPFASSRRARREERITSLVEFLFPPEVREIIDGGNRLFLCPHRKLHGIPFQALPYSKTEYLIERFAVSYVPNLKVLFAPRHPYSIAGEPVFIGSAEYPESKLLSLPGASREVSRITKLWRQRGHHPLSLLDEKAMRGSVLEAVNKGCLSQAPIIHIAAHGEDTPEDAPTEARIFLFKGELNGFDISLWKLKPELVVLSSCYSGARVTGARGMDALPGDDIFGLQAAFFSAGAKRILGARWGVDDRVGEELMVDFHAQLAHLPPAFAWQQTVINYLREASGDKRKTVYWASFFLTEAEF